MRQIREAFISTFGPGLLLGAVALANVALNTDLQAPPRFDGAGYAVLAESIATGQGYREISTPEALRHDHFPPGYPAVLATVWWFNGRSVVAAHILSVSCTVTAVLVAWTWFRTIYPPRMAMILGLALAVNWTWGRVGGSIQSEPVFLFWEQMAVLVAIVAARHARITIGIGLGIILAISILVRHAGVCLAAAILLDLSLRRRWSVLLTAGLTTGTLIAPWISWLILVHRNSQVSFLTLDDLGAQVVKQAIFYLQRLPDHITGPFIEVATTLHHQLPIAIMANFWAAMATGTMISGWVRFIQTPHRRLAGIIVFVTLALLLIWPFTEAGRFLIPLVPFILVGLAEGLARVLARIGSKQSRNCAVTLILVASIPYTVYSISSGRATAQRYSHARFDAACQWVAKEPPGPGPILTRHPGEVFWQTGRLAVAPDSANPDIINQLINRLGVTYILIDEERYIDAGVNPLRHYVEQYQNRVVLVWPKNHGDMSVRVFEIANRQ